MILTETDVATMREIVLATSFSLAIFLGYLLQKTNFCSMGAISDVILMGDFTRMRQWALAILVAALGLGLLNFYDLVDIHKSIYTNPKFLWLSIITGSSLFGFGMVLASGCGAKNLTRVGSGNLKSLVVLVVVAIFAQMTLRGIFASLRSITVDLVYIDLPTNQDLMSILSYYTGMTPYTVLCTKIFLLMALLIYLLKDRSFRQQNNLIAGFGVGVAILGFWFISGYLGYVEEDPNTLEQIYLATNTGKIEAASFVAPMAYTLDFFGLYSDTSKKLTLGIMMVFGLVLGAFISAVKDKKFKWQGFTGTSDTGHHLVGAAMMGVGGVTALGCTFGQGLSGIATLSISSVLALFGFYIGAYASLKYLEKNSHI